MQSYPEFKQYIFDTIKRDFEKNGGIEPFAWMISNTESNVVAMPITEPMDTRAEQQKIRLVMTFAAKKYKAEMVAFVSEAWKATDKGDGKRAGEHADRQEVILINLECNNLVYLSESYYVEIDQKTRKLIDFEHPIPINGVYGWNVGILKAAMGFPEVD